MENEYGEAIINECLTMEEKGQIEKCLLLLKEKGLIELNDFYGEENITFGLAAGWERKTEETINLSIHLKPNTSGLKEVVSNGRAYWIEGHYDKPFKDLGAKFKMLNEDIIKISWS